MDKEYRLVKAFGRNDAGLADPLRKLSGISVSRINIRKITDTGRVKDSINFTQHFKEEENPDD